MCTFPGRSERENDRRIRRLAETYGKNGLSRNHYAVLVTIVANFVAGHRANGSSERTATLLIDRCNDKDLIGQFYSAELLATDKAKPNGLRPDLKALPEATATVRCDYLISSSFPLPARSSTRNLVKSSSVSKTACALK